MAYNRKNILQRMIDIQEIYLKKQAEGLNAITIYRNHVYPVYRISRATFYEYLGTNAKKELKELDRIEKAQLSLF